MRAYVVKNKSCFWDFSMHVDINSIVYLHCHQQEGDDRVSIVLIAHDGIQYPPILFPRGIFRDKNYICLFDVILINLIIIIKEVNF